MDKDPKSKRRGMSVLASVGVLMVVAVAAVLWLTALGGSTDPDEVEKVSPPTRTGKTDDHVAAARAELAAIPGDGAAVADFLEGPGLVLTGFEAELRKLLANADAGCTEFDAVLADFGVAEVYNALTAIPDRPLEEGFGSLQIAAGRAAADCEADPGAGFDHESLAAPLTGITLRFQVLGIRS